MEAINETLALNSTLIAKAEVMTAQQTDPLDDETKTDEEVADSGDLETEERTTDENDPEDDEFKESDKDYFEDEY